MAFTIKKKQRAAAESPEALFNDLRGQRKIEGLLAHQADVLRAYVDKAMDAEDVALQLPTGSGKTLVGLLLGEWRRQKNGERVVYLCPTNQLVHQVVAQSREKYGISVTGFTGSKNAYSQESKAAYLAAETVAVTSYSSLFNTAPFFGNSHLLILDDAHSAENYISSAWSFLVERRKEEHAALFEALAGVLKPALSPETEHHLLLGEAETKWDEDWVDSVPLMAFKPLIQTLTSIIDANVGEAGDLRFPWQWLKGHLDACHIYLARGEILIRPLIPPTETHPAFADAKQRIYMSATLGAGGDLERITGRREIFRLQVPATWDTQGVGRRLFFFPSSSLSGPDIQDLLVAMVKRARHAVVLTTGNKRANELRAILAERTGFRTFDAREIESSKKPFVDAKQAIAVIANRFDGIDFPGKESRLLVVDQLPRATNLQESFFSSRMGANILLNDRVMTRLVQGFGRCTRGATDYSCVLVTGESLFSYLVPKEKRAFFHPELQAEIEFGLEQRGATVGAFLENFDIFLDHSSAWQDAEAAIVELRQDKTQRLLPGTTDLRAAVPFEVEYQYALWDARYTDALDAARSALGSLNEEALKGYRALWNYFAGNAALLAESHAQRAPSGLSMEYYAAARKGVRGVRWLADLGKFSVTETSESEPKHSSASLAVIERLEAQIEKVGTANNFRFDKAEARILKGLLGKEEFESAHAELGKWLGYDAGKIEEDASPDPWWRADDSLCFVFEDHAAAEVTGMVDATKARQAATHHNWIRENLPLRSDALILDVMITPVTKVKSGAVPHVKTLLVWPLKEFREWAINALQTVREIRKSFPGPGDIAWRAVALDAYSTASIDPARLEAKLREITKSIDWKKVP